MRHRDIYVCVILSLGIQSSAVLADQLDAQQIGLVKDTATSICNTVKEAKGQKSDVQIQGEVKGQLSGLLGRLADAGVSGKGTFTRDEFEGLTQDATATALAGDRECRERLFNKMFDKITAKIEGTSQINASCGSVGIGGSVSGSTITAGATNSNCPDKPK